MRFTGSTAIRAGGAPEDLRRTRLEAAVVGVLAATLFVATAARDLSAGDGGELLLAARTWGIPHPPGYPLWVLLAGTFGLLPLGTFAFRVALLSAASAAAGLGVLYRIMVRSGAGRWAAATAALGLAVTPSFWSSAGSVEVYALAFAVDAFAAWAVWEYADFGGARRLFVASFLVSLAVVSHQTAVLLVPLAAWLGFARFRAERFPIRPLLGGIAAGISPFLWLPLRSAQHPVLDWGRDADPVRLLMNLSRACYGPVAQHPLDLGRFLREGLFFGLFQSAEWGWGMLLVAGFGLAAWAVRSRRGALAGALAAAALPVGLSLVLRFEPDAVHAYQVSRFLMPLSAAVAVLLAHGLDSVLRTPARGATLALCFAWVGGSAILHHADADQHDLGVARRYGEDLLKPLPKGATLFVEGDNETFTLAWLQKAEGMRPDVRILHRKGYVFEDPYHLARLPRSEWATRQRAVEASLLNGPGEFFATGDMPLPRGYHLHPEGLVSRISREPDTGAPQPLPALPASLERFRRTDFVTRKLAAGYLEGQAREALRQGRMAEAVEAYRRLAYVAYDFPEAHYDLGRVLMLSGQIEAARGEMYAAMLLAPREAWIREEARRLGLAAS